jgi:hypothetical protein
MLHDSLQFPVQGLHQSPPKNHAMELVNSALFEYQAEKQKLGKDQTLLLMCFISGREVPIDQVGVSDSQTVVVYGSDSEGRRFVNFAMAAQLAFEILIIQKPSESPPKEIGFHSVKSAQSTVT